MSEMEHENIPEVHVPVIRSWPYDAFGAWCDAFYGPRRSAFFVWGIFFWMWLIFGAIKLAIFSAGAAVLIVLAIPALLWDLATYRHRLTLAQRREIEPWARETFQHPRGEYPPGATS
jgi:hypothetical protein